MASGLPPAVPPKPRARARSESHFQVAGLPNVLPFEGGHYGEQPRRNSGSNINVGRDILKINKQYGKITPLYRRSSDSNFDTGLGFSPIDECQQYTQIKSKRPDYENQTITPTRPSIKRPIDIQTKPLHLLRKSTSLNLQLQNKLEDAGLLRLTEMSNPEPTNWRKQEPDWSLQNTYKEASDMVQYNTEVEEEEELDSDDISASEETGTTSVHYTIETNTEEDFSVTCRPIDRDPSCIQECADLFSQVTWIHKHVKETRDMYEKNILKHSIFSAGELKLFYHLDEIEETLHSFIENLKYAVQDVVEVYKLLKYWLQERFFECFESYYLHQDIRKNLLTFVKQHHPDCHMLFQRLSQSTQEYSFRDLEERCKEPNNWCAILARHLQKLKDATVNYRGNTVSQIAHETHKLLENTQARLIADYKKKAKSIANHSSTIVRRIEFPKNEHGLICQEAFHILTEEYAKMQGILLNVNMPKKSEYGRSDYSGSKVYLVVFEKLVLLTTMEENKKDKSTSYQLLECCNRNYVDFEQLPKKASPHPHTFVLYFYQLAGQSKNHYSTNRYILALIGNEVTHTSLLAEWKKAILIPEHGIYETWSRPKYVIRQQYTDKLTGVTFTPEDEVDVIEETDDRAMCHVVRLHDNKFGWFPREKGEQLENDYTKSVRLKRDRREEIKKERELNSQKKKRLRTSGGIGDEEFSKRKTVLGQRFGGVISYRRRLLRSRSTEVNQSKGVNFELPTHNKTDLQRSNYSEKILYGMTMIEKSNSEIQDQAKCVTADEGLYEDPYVFMKSATFDVKTLPEQKTLKNPEKRTKVPFRKDKKKPNVTSRVDCATKADSGNKTDCSPPDRSRSIQKTDQVFSEFVDFVSKTLEDLNTLNSRYVTNAALDPQNGILQEGEYRRLFARIPKLIQFLNDLLEDLQKCNPLDGDQICQLLLDVVTPDCLKRFKDYTVYSRFQEFTLSYLRRKRSSFVEVVRSQETTKDTLDHMLVQPCYFLEKCHFYIKRFQEAIQISYNPEANVVRLAYDLTQNMNRIINECQKHNHELQMKEERHVSKILHSMEFETVEGVLLSEKEKQISNESWVESWNDVIVYSSKKKGSKDWKKSGSNVKLVTFERVVMLINEKHNKKHNEVCYNLIDCANKNFVKVENPSSDTYPFKVPKKKGVSINVFLIVMHNDTCPERRLYYVCWEPSQDRSFEFWQKTLSVSSSDDGEQYAPWSRPKYKIAKEFHKSNSGNLEVNVGDEVEITDRLNGWVRAINLTDSKQGWIPNECLGESIPSTDYTVNG
ncbi:uncharacterized protein [Antedon mediterranea]|uniref:uncharacterized protein isoform X2 n=1 Tax=Antedon mediterranea TaxID=105859 RepID=UPI003AF87F28